MRFYLMFALLLVACDPAVDTSGITVAPPCSREGAFIHVANHRVVNRSCTATIALSKCGTKDRPEFILPPGYGISDVLISPGELCVRVLPPEPRPGLTPLPEFRFVPLGSE